MPTETVTTLPVLEERLAVSVQRVDAGALRVRIVVDERVEATDVELVSTQVRTTTVARNMEVTERLEPYSDGEDLVVPVYEERAVFERRLFLKEEIRLTHIQQTIQQHLDVPLRRERAVLERQQPDGSWIESIEPQGTPLAEKAG